MIYSNKIFQYVKLIKKSFLFIGKAKKNLCSNNFLKIETEISLLALKQICLALKNYRKTLFISDKSAMVEKKDILLEQIENQIQENQLTIKQIERIFSKRSFFAFCIKKEIDKIQHSTVQQIAMAIIISNKIRSIPTPNADTAKENTYSRYRINSEKSTKVTEQSHKKSTYNKNKCYKNQSYF